MNAFPPITLRPRLALARLPDLPLPTVGLALLGVLVFDRAAHGFTDPDFWWHVKTGELIVRGHLIPRSDPFTYTAGGQPWIAHEWLAEVLIFWLVHIGGYGLALVSFTLSPLVALLLVYRQLRQAEVPPPVALALTALTSFMLAPYTTVRPQVLSWALFAVLLFLLASYRSGHTRSLWLLPPLFALWANLHLSFAIGLGLLAFFAATAVCERRLLGRVVQVGHPLVILALSLGAACLNPYGPRLLLAPLRYLPLQSRMGSALRLAEWLPPDFHNPIFAPLLIALLLLFALGVAGRTVDLWRIALGLSTAALALIAVRYGPIFAIAFAPLAGEAIIDHPQLILRFRRARPALAGTASNYLFVVPVLCLLLVALRPGAASQLEVTPVEDPALQPVHAVDVIEQVAPQARIFNEYDWGGYLTYRLWPGNRPFIDGRAEMFPPQVLHDYISVSLAAPGWERTLDRYGVTLVIVRRNSPLAGALEVAPAWHLASRDDLADVFLRETAEDGPAHGAA